MKVSFDTPEKGRAIVEADGFYLECIVGKGLTAYSATVPLTQIPLTSQHIQIWSQVADQLGDEFTHLKSAPTKITQLIHNGLLIPEEGPLLEAMVVAWARKLDTPYVNDPVFRKNFMEDFAIVKARREKTGTFIPENCFEESKREIDVDKERKLQWTPEQRKAYREARKAVSTKNKLYFGFAFVNGVKVEIANYRVEPSSIFMGRGEHPMRGHWKDSVSVENIVLNLSPDAPTPQGFEHANRVFEPEKCYVAKWFDSFSEKWKYVWFGNGVAIRQSGDVAKFEKAENLSKNFDKVMKYIQENLSSKDIVTRKVATVSYLIATLGIRVGDEKDEDEAETVGCTTLQSKHLKFL